LHAVPEARQALPAQQESPALPQETQVAPLQRVPPAVHAAPGQQGWPGPPHAPQDPLAQLPGTRPQAAPAATHVQPTQHPPPLH
jgi:hypothetical protein